MSTPALNIWGIAPSARYEELAAPFRPLFAQILAQAAEADQSRGSLAAVIEQLNALGLPRWRLPQSYGGHGATLVELSRCWPSCPPQTPISPRHCAGTLVFARTCSAPKMSSGAPIGWTA